MGQTKTTRSISATGLFLLIMMTVGLYSCTRTPVRPINGFVPMEWG